jgi:hypothetical protein
MERILDKAIRPKSAHTYAERAGWDRVKLNGAGAFLAFGFGRRGRPFHGKHRGRELVMSILIDGKGELEKTHQL